MMISRHWKISSGHHIQNGHHNTAQIQHCSISTTFHLWVDYDVLLAVAIFKMAAKIQHCPMSSKFDMWLDNDAPNLFLTMKNFYWLPFSKWPPQYHSNSTLSDFNDISYVGRLWCPELIPDIEKFLPLAIFKRATIIPHKFNIVRFQRNFICG